MVAESELQCHLALVVKSSLVEEGHAIAAGRQTGAPLVQLVEGLLEPLLCIMDVAALEFEVRQCIQRSEKIATGIGAPVLTELYDPTFTVIDLAAGYVDLANEVVELVGSER